MLACDTLSAEDRPEAFLSPVVRRNLRCIDQDELELGAVPTNVVLSTSFLISLAVISFLVTVGSEQGHLVEMSVSTLLGIGPH